MLKILAQRPPLMQYYDFPQEALENAVPFSKAKWWLKKYAYSIYRRPNFMYQNEDGSIWIWNSVFCYLVPAHIVLLNTKSLSEK